MALTPERRGQIAYMLLKERLKQEGGMSLDSNFRRQIGNVSKRTGIEFPELLEFTTVMAQEMLAEVTKINEPPTKEELEGKVGH